MLLSTGPCPTAGLETAQAPGHPGQASAHPAPRFPQVIPFREWPLTWSPIPPLFHLRLLLGMECNIKYVLIFPWIGGILKYKVYEEVFVFILGYI